MISSIIQAIIPLLGLWKSKESRKYIDKLTKLEKEYYEEENGDGDRAVLDNIEFELYIIGKAIRADLEKSKTSIL